MTLIKKLIQLNACIEAREWVIKNDTDPETLWYQCERGDWMLWLIGKLDIDRKRIVLVSCQCARLSLHLVPDKETRPRIAIETAEAWVRGEVTLEELNEAVRAAEAAGYDARYAAEAAGYDAGYAAEAAGYAVRAAGYAAEAARYAAEYDAGYAAVRTVRAVRAAYYEDVALKQCADITREFFTYDEVHAALLGNNEGSYEI